MTNVDPTIEAILERNKRVEADKAWEGSWTRRLFIAIVTYLTAVGILWSTGNTNAWLAALFPPAGFILSTLTLPPLRRWWMRMQSVAHTDTRHPQQP